MLLPKEITSLLGLLSEDEKTFDQSVTNFHKLFARTEHFGVCSTLCVLLRDGMLEPVQRLVAFYVLYDVYKSEAAPVNTKSEAAPSNPFLPIFLDTLRSRTYVDQCERSFLISLLCTPPRDLPKLPDLDVLERLVAAALRTKHRHGGRLHAQGPRFATTAATSKVDATDINPPNNRPGNICVATCGWDNQKLKRCHF